MRNCLSALWLSVLSSLTMAIIDASSSNAEQATSNAVVETSWGTMEANPSLGWIQLSISEPERTVSLPSPMPNITRAFLGTPDWPGKPLMFSFNADATEITLHLPDDLHSNSDQPIRAVLEVAEETCQRADGRIIFSALDAEVVGTQAKLESHPGSHRIGFWVNAKDYVQWTYPATRPGNYEVQLTYSAAGQRGVAASDIEVSLGERVLPAQLAATGSWYQYATQSLGSVYLPAKADYTVAVQCIEKRGAAVMNLKSLTLVPISEGEMPKQVDDGAIRLHAKDITVNGTLLQWEPRDIKRTLGYWANPTDSAYWDFSASTAGDYQVEILQGCGQGHGGSQAVFRFYLWGQDQPVAIVPHTVKDTGHWQNFEPMSIGVVTLPAGKLRLRVSAKNKVKAAVMDLRQVTLIPQP